MGKKILITFMVFMMVFGCLVSCSDDNDVPLVGTLDVEMYDMAQDPFYDLVLGVYPIENRTTPIKVIDFNHKNKVSVELNPGNYYVSVTYSQNGQKWSSNVQIQAGKTEKIKFMGVR